MVRLFHPPNPGAALAAGSGARLNVLATRPKWRGYSSGGTDSPCSTSSHLRAGTQPPFKYSYRGGVLVVCRFRPSASSNAAVDHWKNAVLTLFRIPSHQNSAKNAPRTPDQCRQQGKRNHAMPVKYVQNMWRTPL